MAALFGFATTPSRAGSLDIVVQSTTAAPGTIGQFDIDLVNNSAAAVKVASFSVDTLLSDITNVTFTSIDNGTIAPYIFSITGSVPPGFTSNILPMEVSGTDLSATAGQVVNPGETWGLAHVKYLVDPAAPLGTVVNVTLEPTPVNLPSGGTSLLDPAGAQIPFVMVNGTITVQSPTVPEPSTATLYTVSGLMLLFAARICRRRGGTAPKTD
jgi:hypothetical protein